MVKGCAPKIAKLTLLILNFTIWGCSVALLGLGIWMVVRASNFEDLFSEQNATTVAYMMIGIGCFLFIVGFSGCCGARKENTCLLNVYFVLMFLVVIVEAVAGILAFVYSSQIEEYMRIGMNQTIAENYGFTTSATEAVDTIQKNFECCGANDYTDYEHSVFMEDRKQAVPLSCCKATELCILGTPGKPITILDIWPQGCVKASIDTIESNFVAVGAVCLVVLGVEILTMVFARCTLRSIKKEKSMATPIKVKSKKTSSKEKSSSKKSSSKKSSSKKGTPTPATNPGTVPPPTYSETMPPVNVTYPTTEEEVQVVPMKTDQGPYPMVANSTVESDLSPQPEINGGYV